MRATALHHGMAVIELLAQRQSMRFGALQEKVEVSAPTLSAILGELIEAGYVCRTDQGYGLDIGFATTAFRVLKRHPLRRAARRLLIQLRDQTRETAELAVYRNGLVHIDEEESLESVDLIADIGFRLPLRRLHISANGKVVLAFDDDIRERFYKFDSIEQHTAKTVATRSGLEAQFEGIRRDQVAADFGEARLHVARLAAPVFADGRDLAGIIGIAGPLERIRQSQEKFTMYVRQAAMAVTDEMGGRWYA